MTCCSCCHFSVGGARSWALLMGLAQVGVAAAHFIGGIPFTDLTQILGASPTVEQQQILWGALALIVSVRFIFAAKPMCRNVAQLNAIVHCVEVIPFCYLAVNNILLRYATLKPLHIAGGASIIAFALTNACVFYNFWMDRLTGEIRSTTVSRASSVAATTSYAKKVAPPARPSASPAKKKVVAAAVASSSEESAAAASPAPKAKKAAASKSKSRSASPKKKAAAPKKKAASAKPKSRSSSKKAATPAKRASSKKKK